MAVNPKQLLDAAHELAEGSREVDFRNAASRAYYAAYHRCRPIAKRNGLRSSDRGSTVTSSTLCGQPPSRG